MKIPPLLLLLSVGASTNQEPLLVNKCCKRGQHYDFRGSVCVEMTEEQDTAAEELVPPLDDRKEAWLPRFLGSRHVIVQYNTCNPSCGTYSSAAINATTESVQGLLEVNNTARRFALTPFGGRVREFSVWEQHFCLESTEDPGRRRVAVTWVLLAPLPKCCAWGELLDGRTQKCQSSPVASRAPATEVIDPLVSPNATHWLPLSLQGSVVRATHERGPRRPWNVLLDADADVASWRLQLRGHQRKVWLRGHGVSRHFCLDALLPGTRPPRALLALVSAVTKCCGQEQQLDETALGCVGRPGPRRSAQREAFGQVDATNASWLPERLRDGPTTVRFGDDSLLATDERIVLAVDNHSNWRVEWSDAEEATLAVEAPTASGRNATLRTQDFCFDAVPDRSRPRVVVARVRPGREVHLLWKCCASEQRLSSGGKCERNDEEDWSPLNSSVREHLKSDVPYLSKIIDPHFCIEFSYKSAERVSQEEYLLLSGGPVFSPFSRTHHCADLQRTSDGAVREVLASCVWPASTSLFLKLRPLQVVAALLLLAAVAAILVRKDTRHSTHGQALACHAACLMLACTLQAAWFFTHKRHQDCTNFAYSIYFFLMASAFWLNAVAVNMARGFRRPLGALARGGDEGRRRLAILSAYAWGFPAAFTAFAILMHRNSEDLILRGYITPTFFETRTCTKEVVYTFREVEDGVERTEHALGALVYYFVPSAILVAGNAVCLGVAFCRIRQLRKDASLLQRTSRPLRR